MTSGNPLTFFKMKTLLAAALLFLLSGASLEAQDITRLLSEGFTYRDDDRVPFSVEIRMTPFDKDSHQEKSYRGRDEGLPAYVCEEFSFIVNGSKIAIPREAIADLGEILDFDSPYGAESKTWIITVRGGDGGGAYELEMTFDDAKLVQRRFVNYHEETGDPVYYDTKNY
jgi:hypothetical protein